MFRGGFAADRRDCSSGCTGRLGGGRAPLARRGVRTFAPDQRGYSPGAPPPRRRDYGLDLLVGDVAALIESVPGGRAHVVGHDWGAAVAGVFAAHRPDLVRTVTAVSVPHPTAFMRSFFTSGRSDPPGSTRRPTTSVGRTDGKRSSVRATGFPTRSRRSSRGWSSNTSPRTVDHSGAQPFLPQQIDLGQIQRRQRVDSQSAHQEMIGELGIAGEHGTVQIGADHRTLHGTFESVAHAVADTAVDAAESGGIGPESRSTAVVLESRQRLGEAGEGGADDDLADRAGLLRRGGRVEDADTVDAFARGRLVPVAEHLDRGTDGQHGRSALGGALQTRIALQVPRGQSLRGVLGTTEGVEIEGLGDGIVQSDLDDLGVVTAHPQALAQHQGVASVAVGAHHVGQDESDADGRLRHGQLSWRWRC
ncbi:hypothetical protein CEJ39_04635 [Rhodococcus pyridinivorans]|nr:hypothetical protein CEJ39_04635 [Rhodococcus pyridinivorans]